MDQPVEHLTPAEMRVAYLAADGLPHAEIADRLCVTKNTIKTHLRNTYQKLGVDNQTKLAVFAHTGRIVPSGEPLT